MENNYRFYVDALTSDAEAKLNRLKGIMDEIDKLNSKGMANSNRTNTNDVEKNIRLMKELSRISQEVKKDMADAQKTQASSGNNEGVSKLIRDQEKLREEVAKTKVKFNQSMDNRSNMSGLHKDILKDQKMYNDELSQSEQRMRRLLDATKEYTRMASRGDARAHAASSSGRITHQQATRFTSDLEKARMNAPEIKERNQERREQLRSQQESDYQSLRDLRKNFQGDPHERQAYEAQINDNIAMRYKEIEALKKFDDTVESTVNRLEQANNAMSGGNVRQQADPSSMEGIMNSRAPSISMALIGSVMAVVGSMYSKGDTANASMRPTTISIGQRTGDYDFRSIRKANQEMGMEKGIAYKGGDMLEFQDTVLSNAGYSTSEELSESTRQMAEGSRAVGVGKEDLNAVMGDLMQSGSVSGADQIRATQEGFLGAIKKSGMEGREKDQLAALQGLSKQMFSGRNGSNEELQNTMALQTLLASNGDRSMQGQAGAQALTGLDAGIRNGMDSQKMSLIYGRGTKYQGVGGRWEQREQMAKGISDPDNLKTLFDSSKVLAGNGGIDAQKEAFMLQAKEMGADLTTDQVNSMFDSTGGGKNLTEENLAKITKDMKGEGSEQYDKNKEGYTDSKEETADRAEAVAEKQASYLNDLGDAVRSVKASMGGLPAPIYAAGAAALAAATAFATSAAMSAGSGLIKTMTSTIFGGGAASTAAGTVASTAGSAGASGIGSGLAAAGGGFLSGAKGLTGKAVGFGGKMMPMLSKVAPWLAAGTAVTDGFGGASNSKSWLGEKDGGSISGKINSFAGGVIGGNGDGIFGKKQSTGEKAMSVLGGTAKGAAIGSMILPGVGTVIGGGIGAIGSMIGGSNIAKMGQGLWNGAKGVVGGVGSVIGGAGKGLWNGAKSLVGGAGNMISGAWDWLTGNDHKVGATEVTEEDRQNMSGSSGGLSQKENQNKRKEEEANTSEKVQSEKIREANNSKESDNLSLYSTLLDKAEELLARAKAQGGILGSADGKGSGSSGSGSGTGGLNTIGDGKKWTNEDITKHDLGKTMEGLTADQLNEWIDQVAPEDSSMRGLGETFMEAGRQSGLDPRYLVAHAALETGWGGGYANGDPDKGNWFGIGAFDSNPDNAKKYGDGIVGGAKWIADNFYNQGQTTLDGMRHNGGTHEYATDPQWDSKIASIMGGSDKYTKATQTFKTEANINVYTSGGENSGDSQRIGRSIGDAAKASFTEQLDFFTKEMQRV